MNSTSEKPKVSVIMTVYNQAIYVTKAIESVLNQTHTDFEIIAVNDCSTDHSSRVLDRLAQKDGRIKVFHNEQNLGGIRSIAKALSLSKGEYVAKLDGDDYWLDKRKLKYQVDFLDRHPDFNLVGNFVQNVDDKGSDLDKVTLPVSDREIRDSILSKLSIASSAVCFRRNIAVAVGGFRDSIGWVEDLALWLELGKRGKMYNFPAYWTAHRMTSINIGETKRREQLGDMLHLIKRFRADYPNYYYARFRLQLSRLAFLLPGSFIQLIRKFK